MSLVSFTKDPDALTMTMVAEYAAPLERVWDAYADPRQLEKFWGPVEWPATFTRHDFAVGGRSDYVMTGPDGEKAHGFWRFKALERHRSFTVQDGFADSDGAPNSDMPVVTMTFTFEEGSDGTRVITLTTFASAESIEEMLAMGAEAGMRSAQSQVDGVLADSVTFAAERPAVAQILSDTQVRFSRVIRGTVEQVWRAHHDPELVKKWFLSLDGRTMSVCRVAMEVGGDNHFEWGDAASGAVFGLMGKLLEWEPPYRSVTTEHMIGIGGPGTTKEMTLTAVADGCLLSLVITYPSAQVRDIVLSGGMVDGTETSLARLEEQLVSA